MSSNNQTINQSPRGSQHFDVVVLPVGTIPCISPKDSLDALEILRNYGRISLTSNCSVNTDVLLSDLIAVPSRRGTSSSLSSATRPFVGGKTTVVMTRLSDNRPPVVFPRWSLSNICSRGTKLRLSEQLEGGPDNDAMSMAIPSSANDVCGFFNYLGSPDFTEDVCDLVGGIMSNSISGEGCEDRDEDDAQYNSSDRSDKHWISH